MDTPEIDPSLAVTLPEKPWLLLHVNLSRTVLEHFSDYSSKFFFLLNHSTIKSSYSSNYFKHYAEKRE